MPAPFLSVYETQDQIPVGDLVTRLSAAQSEETPKLAACSHISASVQGHFYEAQIKAADRDDPRTPAREIAALLADLKKQIERDTPDGARTCFWLRGPIIVLRRDGIRSCRAIITWS